ncbi:MAG: hypothetical protein DMF77_03655 [Acidobacteria bacterium]|nr:MAG: hypothetical protein DMF77_03655 [Acidobacteriota bacterium]
MVVASMRAPTFWRTYAVAAVAAGLAAYIFLVERKRPEPTEEKPKEKVFTFDRAKVQSITLAPAGAEEIRLVKEKDGWRMKNPADVAADSAQVDSLLSSLDTLQAEEVVTETPAALAEYGLDKPKNTVSVALEGTKAPLVLAVGAKTPDGGALYAKTPDRARVFTIGSHLEGSLDKKPFDLRDREILHVKRDAVRSLEVSGPEGSYALSRTEGGDWALTQPVATQAGRWSVDALLGSLESLRMDSVADESPKELKPFGLDKPVRTVTLGLSDGTRKTLEIGAATADKKYDVRVSDRPLVAVIPGAVVDELAKGMNELRAKRLLEIATYDVSGFEAEAGGAKRTYARSTTKDKDGLEVSKWRRTAPDAKDLETNKVQDALFAIGGVDVVEFVDKPSVPATYGLDQPALKVTLRFDGGKAPVTFELAERGGASYARRSGDAAVLKVDPKKAADVVKAFKEL